MNAPEPTRRIAYHEAEGALWLLPTMRSKGLGLIAETVTVHGSAGSLRVLSGRVEDGEAHETWAHVLRVDGQPDVFLGFLRVAAGDPPHARLATIAGAILDALLVAQMNPHLLIEPLRASAFGPPRNGDRA